MSIKIINFSSRPAHKKHIECLRSWMNHNSIEEGGWKSKTYFFQTTHPLNIFVFLFAKIIGSKSVYYYHEPCFYKEKLKKGDGWGYSAAVKFVQFIEYLMADLVLVSNSFLVRKVRRLHRVSKNIEVLRLSIDEATERNTRKTIDVLFLGRANEQRSLSLFVDVAKQLDKYTFAILTASNIEFHDHIEVISAGVEFSDELRIQTLSKSKFVWNVYSSNYNQSGVVPDALAHSCGILHSRYERDRNLLRQDFAKVIPLVDSKAVSAVEEILEEFKLNITPKDALLYFQKNHSVRSYDVLSRHIK